MYSGTDCPYKGGAERTAQLINKVYPLMTERGISTRRLRLVAICTVCTSAFMREITQMNQTLAEIGPVQNELTAVAQSSASGKG
jgi:coenzyme F420-reducing hydrogenase delta subunit